MWCFVARGNRFKVSRLQSSFFSFASDVSASAKNLKSAITALPQLTEKKRVLDMHMNIASALLKVINDRSIDAFVMAEETPSKLSRSSILEILNDPKKGTAEDKLRLVLVYYLSAENDISKDEVKEYEAALTKAGANLAVFDYVKR